jgi:hypothetical protein
VQTAATEVDGAVEAGVEATAAAVAETGVEEASTAAAAEVDATEVDVVASSGQSTRIRPIERERTNLPTQEKRLEAGDRLTGHFGPGSRF